jgi:hypothetical protein
MDAFTARELERRYNGGFGYLSTEKGSMPVRFRDFQIFELEDEYYCFVETAKSSSLKLDLKTVDIAPIQHRKLFQTDSSFCLYSRLPKRQFRKGYTSDNAYILDVVVNCMQHSGVPIKANPNSKLSLATVAGFHETVYPNSYEDAVAKLGDTCIGSVVTDTFGVGLSFIEGADYILFYLQKPIALISGKTFKVLSLKQEVVDFVKRFTKGEYNVVE